MAPRDSFTDDLVAQTEAMARSLSFMTPTDSRFTEEWSQRLKGCRLTLVSTTTSDYQSSGSRTRNVIDLCPGGRFSYRGISTLTANLPDGAGGHARDLREGRGRWDAISMGASPALKLSFESGEVRTYLIGESDTGVLLNDRRFIRTCDPNDPYEPARPRCP